MTGRERRAWSPEPFLAHLNQRHPDTVLFVIRYLTRAPEVSAAGLVGVAADQLTLEVTAPGPARTMTVTLPDPVASRAELLTVLGCVLADARAAAPAGPLTSLEADMAERSRGAHGH